MFDCPIQMDLSPAYPCKKKNTKEIVMKTELNVNTSGFKDETPDQRKHLHQRAYRSKLQKNYDLRQAFKMDGAPQPKTLTEAIERLKAGRFDFEIDLDAEDDVKWRRYFFEMLIWRDEPADKEGFQKALNALDAAYQTLEDEITINDPLEALTALREFEAKTFH